MCRFAVGVLDWLNLDVHPIRTTVLPVVQDFSVKSLASNEFVPHFFGDLRVREGAL